MKFEKFLKKSIFQPTTNIDNSSNRKLMSFEHCTWPIIPITLEHQQAQRRVLIASDKSVFADVTPITQLIDNSLVVPDLMDLPAISVCECSQLIISSGKHHSGTDHCHCVDGLAVSSHGLQWPMQTAVWGTRVTHSGNISRRFFFPLLYCTNWLKFRELNEFENFLKWKFFWIFWIFEFLSFLNFFWSNIFSRYCYRTNIFENWTGIFRKSWNWKFFFRFSDFFSSFFQDVIFRQIFWRSSFSKRSIFKIHLEFSGIFETEKKTFL